MLIETDIVTSNNIFFIFAPSQDKYCRSSNQTIMKKVLIAALAFIILTGTYSFVTNNSQAARYYKTIYEIVRGVNVKELKYTQSIIYKRRQAKVEHKKDKLSAETHEAITKLKALPPFDGDSTLRDVTINVLQKKLEIMKVEMPKIDEMEATAYDSYEALEHYYAAQKKVMDKLEKEFNRLVAVQEEFALANDMTLSEDHSRLSRQLKNISEVNDYIQPIYLMVFKVEKEVAAYYDAVQEFDTEAAEKYRKTILEYSNYGVKTISKEKSFRGNRAFLSTSSSILRFYQRHSKTTFVKINQYLKKGKDMKRSDAKQFNQLIGNYQKQYKDAYSRYQNGYYSFQQKYVSRW